MNNNIFNSNNTYTVTVIIIITLLLLLLLRLLRDYLPLLPRKEKRRVWLRKQLFFIELIIWLLYISFITPHIIDTNIIFIIVFIAIALSVIGIFIYYFFRDYFSGKIIRLNYHIEVGDIVKFENITGRIRRFSSQNIEIESIDNELFYIPYTKIKKGVICKMSNEQNIICSFELSIQSTKLNSHSLNDIKKFILAYPSVSTQDEPYVKINKIDKTKTTVNVSFTSLDEERNDIIIEEVKNTFESID